MVNFCLPERTANNFNIQIAEPVLSRFNLTVVTPAFNPRPDFLQKSFEGLKAQSLSKDQWEYLVVDSGSEPPLKGKIDLTWHSSSRLLVAPEQRLVISRLRGLQQASGKYVVFVDDDNVLDPDFLQRAIEIMDGHPFIGVIGAYCVGEFEVEPEPWMHEFMHLLSAMQFDQRSQLPLQYALTRANGPWMPAGNGMVLRREVVDAYLKRVEENPAWLNIGRVGQGLMGSEDMDLIFTAIDEGYAIGKSMDLKLTHLIPARRLTLEYLRRLHYASHYAANRLAIERGWRSPEPASPPSVLKRLREKLSTYRRLSPADEVWLAIQRGTRDGRCGAPFDERYR